MSTSTFNRWFRSRAHRLQKRLQDTTPRLPFLEKERAFLRALFVPDHFAQQLGLNNADPTRLFDQFIAEGLANGYSPSPLFEPEYLKTAYSEFSMFRDHRELFIAWLRHPQRKVFVPTQRFDASQYLRFYPDLRAARVDPFEHFISHGLAEGRRPNYIFDCDWYQRGENDRLGQEPLPPYLHFLIYGCTEGASPNLILLPVYEHRDKNETYGLGHYDSLLRALKPWADKFDFRKTGILLGLFLSISYDGNGQLDENSGGISRLIHFLNIGLCGGLDPGPMFESQYYLDRIAERGLATAPGYLPLVHFLTYGVEARIVPTKLFSEEYYQRTHADVAAAGVWGFDHFNRHGIFEGRTTRGAIGSTTLRPPPALTVSSPTYDRDRGKELANWHRFWASWREGVPQDPLPHYYNMLERRLTSVLDSDLFSEIMRRSLELEPAIGDVRDIGDFLAAPLHDVRNQVRKQLESRMPRKAYDTIICVPWIRTGGADLIACQLAQAVKITDPHASVLLLRTDYPNLERPDWIPADIDVVDGSDLLGAVLIDHAQMLLYSLILGLKAKNVINVNSHLCWRVLVRFGSRLSHETNLYAYLFCWDQNVNGIRTGYPDFYPKTAAFLKAVFTDTEYLRHELIRIYRPPVRLTERVVALYSPFRSNIPARTAASESLARTKLHARPQVLWAGRLDRQKRFDLVQQIAKAMPDVDFLCWGSALLDERPDVQAMPSNLVLHPPFQSYDEMPLRDADLWLFTSAWEGIPTILIEIAIRGMAVVATAVGGVPELLDSSTGWPIGTYAGPQDYVQAIREALASPLERISRAGRLQERAAARHSPHAYNQQVSSIIKSVISTQ